MATKRKNVPKTHASDRPQPGGNPNRPAPRPNPNRPPPGPDPFRPLPGGNPNRPSAVTGRTRPRFIIAFREPSEHNASLMSKIRSVGAVPGLTAMRAGRVVLEAQSEDRARTCVYERLGVATSDLTPEEAAALRRNDSVRLVVPNEIRTLPTLRRVVMAEEGTGPEDGPMAVRPLEAYLRGMTDAIRDIGSFSGSLVLPHPGFAAAAAAPAPTTGAQHSWCLNAVGIPPSYSKATGKGVVVAVLDTGVNLDHPDLAGRFEEGRNAVSFVEGLSVLDRNGHGTHCAGVIAGPARSAGGKRYGVAPEVDLMVGKVLDDIGSGWDDDILEGIDWAVDRGARVISMSLGSSRAVNGAAAEAYETVAETLFKTSPGILLLAAAGNSSERPARISPVENPAACPSVFAVAACDRQLQAAWFSCGRLDFARVDVTGPGVGVYSAYLGRRYAILDGTSMATPHAAGIAALHLQLNPALTATQLIQALTGSAVELSPEDDFGAGLVQAP